MNIIPRWLVSDFSLAMLSQMSIGTEKGEWVHSELCLLAGREEGQRERELLMSARESKEIKPA